ncbi:adapter molecule Crk-like [Babylonia areolata]|uniref:adapter molecule Crk-like n=1 Tax=Babylonia areolata TaxID=304850 RepID=UPI003FD09DF0
MEADFDPEDKYSWYFGHLSRDETNDILKNKREGVFLVRGSSTVQGGFVLCVKEDDKVSHYIINRVQANGVARFKIGEIEFDNIPNLLKFYRSHYLDTTTLIKPAPRAKLIGKFNFNSEDREDLNFQKGDILELISKDEEDWWTARDKQGRVGQIPVLYITVMDDSAAVVPTSASTENQPRPDNASSQSPLERRLPAPARVILDRMPCAYDKTQLRLKKGETITVLATNIDGQWEGEVNGRRGKFPFTHVQFLNDDELPPM